MKKIILFITLLILNENFYQTVKGGDYEDGAFTRGITKRAKRTINRFKGNPLGGFCLFGLLATFDRKLLSDPQKKGQNIFKSSGQNFLPKNQNINLFYESIDSLFLLAHKFDLELSKKFTEKIKNKLKWHSDQEKITKEQTQKITEEQIQEMTQEQLKMTEKQITDILFKKEPIDHTFNPNELKNIIVNFFNMIHPKYKKIIAVYESNFYKIFEFRRNFEEFGKNYGVNQIYTSDDQFAFKGCMKEKDTHLNKGRNFIYSYYELGEIKAKKINKELLELYDKIHGNRKNHEKNRRILFGLLKKVREKLKSLESNKIGTI